MNWCIPDCYGVPGPPGEAVQRVPAGHPNTIDHRLIRARLEKPVVTLHRGTGSITIQYKDMLSVPRLSDMRAEASRLGQIQCREPKKGKLKVQLKVMTTGFAHLALIMLCHMALTNKAQSGQGRACLEV